MSEITNVFVSSTKRRLMIGCISTLIGIPAVVCCLAILTTVVFPALDKSVASGDENIAIYAMLGIGLLVLIGLFVIPIVALIIITLRRARTLDAIFTPLGLTGRAYMLNGRHYQGQIGGREVDVYIYRGPTVEIRLHADVQTSLLVVPKGSLPTSVAWIFDKQPIATNSIALAPFSIFPKDKAWTSILLSDPRTGDAIQTLMTTGADWAIFRRVEIQPGEVMLYLYRSHSVFGYSIDLNASQTWLNALKSLALAAESQPAPEVTGQPLNATTRRSRQKRSNFLVYAVVFIVFVMPLCFIAIGVCAYLAVTLFG